MSIPVMQEVGSTALKRASKDLRGNLTFMLAVAANCHPSEVVWYLAAVHLYFFIFFQVTHTHARTHARTLQEYFMKHCFVLERIVLWQNLILMKAISDRTDEYGVHY